MVKKSRQSAYYVLPCSAILQKSREATAGKLFPRTNNTFVNRHLKTIATAGGINRRLICHQGRYTEASAVFLANNVSMENVAKILGHSN